MRPDTMKAAVFYGPGRISVQQRAVPDSGSCLLKVASCAVCGYDVRVFQNGHGKVQPPVILGHEICGETVEGLPSIAPGTRVAVYPIMPCLHCGYCRRGQYNLCANRKEIGSTVDGGFAEYVAVPEEIVKVGGLVPIPDSVTSEEAALIEPLACCLNGFTQLGTIRPEHTVAIIGDGPIGLIHLQLSINLFGAKTVIVGCNRERMRRAELLGAHAVFDARHAGADDILQASSETGFDVVVIAASDPAATDLAFKIAGRGSRVSLFAGRSTARLDYGLLHYNQVSVIGSFSSLPHNLQDAVRIAAERKVVDLSKMITHRFGLDQIHEALSATANYHGLRVAVSAR